MKHRKKKKTKQNKQEARHQRNEFYKKLKQTMTLLGDASAMDLLDKRDLATLHYCRLRPYKIINPNNGQPKINNRNLQILNKGLSILLHKSFIWVGEQQIQLSLYDFFVYAETLYFQYRNIPENHPEIAAKFQDCFPVFNEDYRKIRVDATESINKRLEFLSWLYSDFTSSILRFIPVEIVKSSSVLDTSSFYNNYIVEQKKAETELLEIDGKRRTIYRICLSTDQNFIPLTITPDKLGIEGLMQKFPLKVFIQMHALHRIRERLGNQFLHLSYVYIVHAIKEKSIKAENNNSFLFPVTHNTIKLGYLKGDIIGDKLVIRTFLFLTNNGTPEGKKLQNMAGLQKTDKKFLGIDKLNTFINSDIKENEKLKTLFCQAGCGDLFLFDKNVLDQPDEKEIACAEYLEHYLGI